MVADIFRVPRGSMTLGPECVVFVFGGASATSLGEGDKGHTPDPPQQNPTAHKPFCHHQLAELPPPPISSTHVWYAIAKQARRTLVSIPGASSMAS